MGLSAGLYTVTFGSVVAWVAAFLATLCGPYLVVRYALRWPVMTKEQRREVNRLAWVVGRVLGPLECAGGAVVIIGYYPAKVPVWVDWALLPIGAAVVGLSIWAQMRGAAFLQEAGLSEEEIDYGVRGNRSRSWGLAGVLVSIPLLAAMLALGLWAILPPYR